MEPQQQPEKNPPNNDNYFHPSTEGLMPPPNLPPHKNPPNQNKKSFKINFPNISAPNVARTLSLRGKTPQNPGKGSLRSLPSGGDGDLKKLRGQSAPVLPQNKNKLDTGGSSQGRKSRSSSIRQNCVVS